MPSTRRVFLKNATTAAAGLAGVTVLPLRWLDPRLSANQLIAGATVMYDEAEVRALALRALDIAKSAGASFADVRVNQGRIMAINIGTIVNTFEHTSENTVGPLVGTTGAIGVRAVVDGAWGFSGDSELTPEGVERAARLAVAYARDGRRRVPRAWEYAPAPVVPSGRWETPIETDPFTLSMGYYMELYRSALEEVEKIKGVGGAGGEPYWLTTERLFASTEGSMIVQRTHESSANVGAWAPRPSDRRLSVSEKTSMPAGGYGYEPLAKVDLKAEWCRAGEEAVRKAMLPYRSAEVGQYDLVFGTDAMAGLMLPTGRALELDRALGHKANESGTTFAMPPEEILGKYRLGSNLVTIKGDRSRPRATGTIGWDEEGVKPEEFPLVQGGTVVDYVTTRRTAPALAAWYGAQNKPVRSHGCAARTGGLQPILQLPNLTLEPAPGSASVDELIHGVKRGYYVESGGPMPDQQLINMQLIAGSAYEITNGKLGPAAVDLGVQFALPRFWQNVVALGGAATAELLHIGVDGPDNDRLSSVGAYVVPALVRQLNVINTGREA